MNGKKRIEICEIGKHTRGKGSELVVIKVKEKSEDRNEGGKKREKE